MILFISFLFIILLIVIGWILAPKFLESHKYEVIKKNNKFEIRRYEQVQIVEVFQKDFRKNSLKSGFRRLIKYISSENVANEKISMTIPVMQKKNNADDEWTIQFVLPKKYSAKNTPSPNNSDLKIKTFDLNYAAVIRFSGAADDKLIAENEKLLIDWIKKENLIISSSSIYAFYNDPLTPGIFRRNEILFKLKYDN